jgi:hypothetical protein
MKVDAANTNCWVGDMRGIRAALGNFFDEEKIATRVHVTCYHVRCLFRCSHRTNQIHNTTLWTTVGMAKALFSIGGKQTLSDWILVLKVHWIFPRPWKGMVMQGCAAQANRVIYRPMRPQSQHANYKCPRRFCGRFALLLCQIALSQCWNRSETG